MIYNCPGKAHAVGFGGRLCALACFSAPHRKASRVALGGVEPREVPGPRVNPRMGRSLCPVARLSGARRRDGASSGPEAGLVPWYTAPPARGGRLRKPEQGIRSWLMCNQCMLISYPPTHIRWISWGVTHLALTRASYVAT